jgi:putative transport protein
MIPLLLNNPLVLLFAVVAVGYLLGRIKVAGVSFGVAAILFVGLAAGSLHPDMKLPEIVYILGLVLFVYTIGLNSGPMLLASFRGKGLRGNMLVLGVLVCMALVALAAHAAFGLKATLTAGMFAGSLTNTPALAGVVEYVQAHAPPEVVDQLVAEPVIGYSIAYPMGVVAMLLTISLIQRLWRIDYAKEAADVSGFGASGERLHNRTIRVTRPEATSRDVGTMADEYHWDVVFGRLQRNGGLSLARDETRLEIGDLVSVVGPAEHVERVTAHLGEPSAERLELSRSEIDFRRIFVSSSKVAGHCLRDLNLPQQFGAVVTRVRRGDVEFTPHGDTVLELGDRVRVVTQRGNMGAVSEFFGDSYRAVSEFDILSFSVGVALGVLLGLVPIPFPGGTIRLGLAGGPLVVALVLGALKRTGPIVWALPYSANLTLREIGLILFLAGIGTRSGYTFFTTVAQSGGLVMFVAGALITTAAALLTLWVGRRLLKIPMGLLVGMVAGLQTQPAVLAFALEQSRDDLPNVGYATVYPLAMISKIILAQLLLVLLM